MIETHMTTVYTDGSAENHITICADAAQMLEDYAGCTILNEDTDSSTYYEAILSAAGNAYVRISYRLNSGTNATLTLSYGQRINGQYVWARVYSRSQVNTGSTTERYARLRVVNRGAAWSLVFSIRAYSAPYYEHDYMNLSAVVLKSSLTGAEMFCGSGDNDTQTINPFPNPGGNVYYYAVFNGDSYGVPSMAIANARNNIEAGKILLFPSLIYISATENNLGVPTIGDGRTYYMGLPNGVSLPAYTEFTVNGGRYVSLGNVAIPST